ncbi:MAG: thioredoxin-disulfide reductase [Candidatus Firestonebacteria bacterium]
MKARKTAIKNYDVVIIGGGPAGLTAAIYAARGKLDILIIEKALVGGTSLMIDKLENYPGFPEGVNGYELATKMEAQARRFGAEIVQDEVLEIKKDGGKFIVKSQGSDYTCKAVIVASGTKPQKLGVEGEDRFTGKGLSWCATCDGAFYKGLKVAVIGGGNSALHEAVYLTRFASEVHIVHRRQEFRASPALIDRIKTNPKIKLHLDSVLNKIDGSSKVESITLKNVKDGSLKEVKIDGVFEAIGSVPNTSFCKNFLRLDEKGNIITDDSLETSEPGVFAVGDVRNTKLRQVATAVGDGAYVAAALERFLAVSN